MGLRVFHNKEFHIPPKNFWLHTTYVSIAQVQYVLTSISDYDEDMNFPTYYDYCDLSDYDEKVGDDTAAGASTASQPPPATASPQTSNNGVVSLSPVPAPPPPGTSTLVLAPAPDQTQQQPVPGTSRDPVLDTEINAIAQTTDPSSSLQEQRPELDPELMDILGEDPTSTKDYGPDIQNDLAIRLNHIVCAGLSKEMRKELKDKYLIPSNC